MDNCCDTSDVVRKFFGAVNSTVAKLGGFCTSDEAWMRIVDGKLFPALVYGCHLWEINWQKDNDMIYRRSVRRGLGMNSRESIRNRFPD